MAERYKHISNRECTQNQCRSSCVAKHSNVIPVNLSAASPIECVVANRTRTICGDLFDNATEIKHS